VNQARSLPYNAAPPRKGTGDERRVGEVRAVDRLPQLTCRCVDALPELTRSRGAPACAFTAFAAKRPAALPREPTAAQMLPLPAAADAVTALHDIRSPALDRLIARATLVERVIGEDFQRTLPHERWIARQFGALSTSATSATSATSTTRPADATNASPAADEA